MRLDEVDDDLDRLENIVASLIDTLRRELLYRDREAAKEKFEQVDASFRRHITKASLTTEEAMLVEDSLRDIISCTIGAIHDGDPDDRPRLKREIEVLHDVVARLKEQRNRSVQAETV